MTLTAQALLFDMDGTLVDSTVVVVQTWRDFAARHGLDAEVVLASAHGRRTGETVRAHAPAGVDVDAETARIEAAEIVTTDGIVAVPGAADLLATLPPDRWALVTSAGLALAESRMAAAGLAMPARVVSADDVSEGKPHPEGYLAGAATLGVPASETIVLEDAAAGIEAGRASGAQVLVVGDQAGAAGEGLPQVTDFRELRVELDATGRFALHGARVGVPQPAG